ncbi:MAG: flagellar hook-basal body complex protein FliE [Gemmatimonadetes bacterium]|nr:flagellar hook-basal body complex protein FliE [Gemmatimonadota bacterium]MBI3568649.1 flagellar hook-basal body complex protein FliE [Gemmatimonadota bacterium]
MSDPIGGIASKLTRSLTPGMTQGLQGLAQGLTDSLTSGLTQGPGTKVGGGFGDTGARQVPLLGGADGGSFGDSLKRALNDVSTTQERAADTISAFLRGDNVEIHQVMAASDEAQISLQMLIEVRNKFTEAYRSLANMQG